jgi:hypothetical protein
MRFARNCMETEQFRFAEAATVIVTAQNLANLATTAAVDAAVATHAQALLDLTAAHDSALTGAVNAATAAGVVQGMAAQVAADAVAAPGNAAALSGPVVDANAPLAVANAPVPGAPANAAAAANGAVFRPDPVARLRFKKWVILNQGYRGRTWGLLVEDGPYTRRDFYVAGLAFSEEDWARLPTTTLPQQGVLGAGLGGGFVDVLPQFRVSGTFANNRNGMVVPGGIGTFC